MYLQLCKLPQLLAEGRSSALYGLVLIALVWLGVAAKLGVDVGDGVKGAARANQNFAMVLEENVLRTIGEIDKALLYLRRSIETRKASSDYATIVNTTDLLSDIIVQVAIVDADGVLRASNAGAQTPPALNLSDREHFKVHVGRAEDGLFISRPVLGRASGRWSVQFTRRFSHEDGSFAGVVVASLNPAHLTKLYDRIDLGPSATIAIIGADGVVRSSGGSGGEFGLGQSLAGGEIHAHIEAGANATFELARPGDGAVRLVTLREVSGHPLWVGVSVARGEVLRGAWAALRLNAAVALALTAIILAVMERVFRGEAREIEARADVARLATEDPLTGLPNRRVLRSAIDRLVNRRGDGDAEERFGVLFMDLDRFKVINDTLGHRAGDRLLQEVARRLGGELRRQDVLARLGGDEFAVVIPAIEGLADLERIARRLVDAAVPPYEVDGQPIRSSVSIGIAVGPRDGATADDLLVAADLALYAAKAERRGTYRFYDSAMNREVTERRQIEVDLRRALEAGELELHYQPIGDVRSGALTGFEALARWRHPTRGMVSPGLFIPVAEDTRLILPLGEWALREACRQATGWPADLKVAVNLSPVQFSDPGLTAMVEGVLAETGLSPHRLELEITERVLVEDGEETLRVLRRLKELGLRISMDDFGTGYSSLSYLRSFPFDKIKVDRSFVSDVARGTAQVAIVQAVITLAHALGMIATAEGVETPEQHRLIAALGCDEVQGYLLGRPLPQADLAARLPAPAEAGPGEASLAA